MGLTSVWWMRSASFLFPVRGPEALQTLNLLFPVPRSGSLPTLSLKNQWIYRHPLKNLDLRMLFTDIRLEVRFAHSRFQIRYGICDISVSLTTATPDARILRIPLLLPKEWYLYRESWGQGSQEHQSLSGELAKRWLSMNMGWWNRLSS